MKPSFLLVLKHSPGVPAAVFLHRESSKDLQGRAPRFAGLKEPKNRQGLALFFVS